MPDTPEISAILTTHNRASLLPRVLDGLVAQTLAPARFEVIAVDDGSSDETPAVLSAYATRLPLRIAHQPPSGLAAAKNRGIAMCRSAIVVFLDDDDIADPDLLMVHLETHARHPDPNVAVLGRTDLDPAIAGLPLMRHVTGAGGQLFSYAGMQPGQWLSFREFWGGRSSCKRDLLMAWGVFNPVFRFGCEDIELAWRLHAAAGLRVLYEPAARTRMIRAISFDDFCRRAIRQGRSQWAFALLHDTPAVQDYCEIDRSLALWPQVKGDVAAILRWAKGLDQMMINRGASAAPLPVEVQAELDAAYDQAFFLCRVKGVADASSLSAAALPAIPPYGRSSAIKRPRPLSAPVSARWPRCA